MRRIYSNGKKDGDVVYTHLREMLRESKRCDLAAPFFTLADPILEVAGKGKKIRLLVEINGITSLDELDDVLGKTGIKVKYFEKNFHAKIYVFDTTVLLGSANLTGAGLNTNREAVIKLCQEENPDAIKQVSNLFNELWRQAKPLTKEKLVEFEERHKELSRNISKSREARENAESESGSDPVDARVRPPFVRNKGTSNRTKSGNKGTGNGGVGPKSPKPSGIDNNALIEACEMVFGTSHNMITGKNRPDIPPVKIIHGLNFHFGNIYFHGNLCKVFFLPQSWVNPMGKTWQDCKWKRGFFTQPLMVDFCFDADNNRVKLFGQLHKDPGNDRNEIVDRIEIAAENLKPQTRIGFHARYDPMHPQSTFFKDHEYSLKGKYDAKSLAKIMRKVINDFTVSIDEIGKSIK